MLFLKVDQLKDHVDSQFFFNLQKVEQSASETKNIKLPVSTWKHVFYPIWCDFWNQQTQKWLFKKI